MRRKLPYDPHRRKAKTACMAKWLTDNPGMTKAGNNDTKPDKKGRRSDRLAVALRENLQIGRAHV